MNCQFMDELPGYTPFHMVDDNDHIDPVGASKLSVRVRDFIKFLLDPRRKALITPLFRLDVLGHFPIIPLDDLRWFRSCLAVDP